MANPSQSNRGNLRRNAGSGEVRQSARPMQTVPKEAENEERSPLLLLARRIREEQGAEGLKAFFSAMEPFAAPYELKNLAERFGMEHPVHTNAQKQGSASEPNAAFSASKGGFSSPNSGGFNMNGMNGMNGMSGMGGAQQNPGMGFDPNMIRMMQMMNGAGIGGGNSGNMNQMMQLMQMMRLLPMLQNMGKGGADISQIIKMMNM